MNVFTLAVGPLQCNCTIAICSKSKKALVIDPGGDYPKIQSILKDAGASVQWILHTHAHIDHVGATAELRTAHQPSSCQCSFHPGEKWLIENLDIQARFIPVPYGRIETVDHWIADGERIQVGETLEVEVNHTPGHTPGSTSFLISENQKPQLICSGDTLFRGGIGRTDLWGGDYDLIMKSLTQKLLQWPSAVRVVTGHGTDTTLEFERETNPFLTEARL